MASGEVIAILEKLRITSEVDNEHSGQQFEKLLNEIHKIDDNSAVCQELVNEGILPIINKTLQNKTNEGQTKAAELVAELAKVEGCRIACVEHSIVPVLVDKMSSEETATALQACRALGNICYEYDGGRVCVMKCGGATHLLNLLKRAAVLPDKAENHQLRLVATGFLLNLLNSYDTAEDHPIDAVLVEVLCQYLDKFAMDEDIPTHILLSLSCMADSDVSRGLVVSKDITPQLVKVLSGNESAEVIETCLELISNLAETECVKTQLALGGVCQAVVSVVNRHRENPSPELSPPIIKTATDLLVLILVGDESMGVVYGNGEGPVYKELVNWLTSDLEDLQIAGALAMGNFARNDTHCVQMVQEGIAEKLLQVLKGHNHPEGDIRLQHALLSALRNLSIAKENKSPIIKQGSLDILLPMVSTIETYPVVFKLLATLRMIIDGQKNAAIEVGCKNIVERLVSWCSILDHPGVQGEASRILAWIIKNCDGNDDVISSMVKAGSLHPLVAMLGSEHAVMVNEAALALALIFSKDVKASQNGSLQDTAFIKTVVCVLKNKLIPPEVISNVLSALVALARSDDTLLMAENIDLKSAVGECASSHPNEEVQSLSKKLLQILQA